MDLPYRAEYAKTGRSSCKGCRSPIGQGLLRIAVMVQSSMFDGKSPNWYHFMCFFSKQRPKTVDDIDHFEALRIEDQEKIRESIGNAASVIVPDKKGKGKKRDAAAAAAKNAALNDFKIEYSKSSRATCQGCEQKIMKEVVRIAKKDFESEVGRKYGGQDKWHHLTCFAKMRSELGFYESADKLPGFKGLNKNDQAEAKKAIPAIKQEDLPEVKKVKTEDDAPGVNSDGFTPEQQKLYAEHNKIYFKYRDGLNTLTKPDLSELLTYNNQEVPAGKDRILDHLADIMTYGVLSPCKECKEGQLVFDKYGYRCHGDLTEWTKCKKLVKEPPRTTFKVPSEFKESYPFLKKYKYVPRTRLVKNEPASLKKDETDGATEPKVKRETPPLYNMQFVILGKTTKDKDELKKEIVKLGGKVVTRISSSIMAVIASAAEVEKMGARMQEVKSNLVHVVPEEFIERAAETKKITDLIIEMTNCDWGSDPSTRLPPEPSGSGKSLKSRSIYTSSMPSKVKLKLKGGTAVDPDSGLDHLAHVHQDATGKYTVVLTKTDIQTKQNSYYKLQLLRADQGGDYWVFRSWGRIGTTIGSNKVTKHASLHQAKHEFTEVYEEKTGNEWGAGDSFQKRPGLFYPIDVDYGEEDGGPSMDITDSASKLPVPVQNLMRLIFDVQAMKKVMMEFELDMEKMPLGKLSKKQLQSAYSVLAELQRLVDENGAEARFIDACNRFYTFVPHSFGIDDPPILRTAEEIQQKREMIDNLMDLEIAYSLMKSSGGEHTTDSYYAQLNTEIGVVERSSEEFQLIHEYVQNTHAETHSSYKLDLLEVFTIRRQGEEKRFKPFKKLHNQKLLWHGSRTTNYAGILSQGLRIAPPEAPVTGYMFGKGIYFADMVSKSANYCCTSPQNNKGLLLLSEVALGNMHEKTRAEYIEKLPKGKHSTKGLGRTHPDPSASRTLNGVEVPLGKGVPANVPNSSLLYNEYIVYDIAQVNIKYLLKVDFKYGY